MNLFFNSLELPTPVIISSKLNVNDSYANVSELKTLMNRIKNAMNDFNYLDLEAAALSRLLYRTKHKHRQDKSFKFMQKINRCLTNYKTMHLPFTLSSIQNTLYSDSGPTRQMMEWALVRLLGVAHLFHRIFSLCEEAAGHIFIKIKIDHFFELSLFSLATVSRIWTLSQLFVQRACEWYGNLYQYLDKLKATAIPWLPEGYILKEDISESLGNPRYLQVKAISKPSTMVSQLLGPLPENEKTLTSKRINSIFDVELLDDIGESITRELLVDKEIGKNQANVLHMEMNHKNKRRKKNKKNNDNDANINESPIENIKSSKDLIIFLKTETALRENTSNKSKPGQNSVSLLGKTDKLQWSLIHKCIKKHIKLISKAEQSGCLKKQKKLIQAIRENIIKWSSFLC